MITNYLKTCFRLLFRNTFFSLTNFLGLSFGLVVFAILWQYSDYGLQSEHFIPNHKNISRLCIKASWTDDKINWQESLCGFAHAQVPVKFSEKYPEIQGFTRMFPQKDFSKALTGYHGKEIVMSYLDDHGLKHSFIETKTIYADANIFSFFGLPLAYGNSEEVLKSPNSVVISEKEAKKFFGSENPIGQSLMLNDSLPLQVTGVFKDLPGNSHLDFELVLAVTRIKPALVEFGGTARAHCYVSVKDGIDLRNLAKKLNSEENEFIKRSTWGDWAFGRAELFFQKLDDAPFESYRFDYYEPKSKYIYTILRYASLLILLMAWINYINLTLSANYKRMKELAVRKATGARTKDIAIQFLIEAFILNLFSLIAAIAILYGSREAIENWLQFHVPDLGKISFSMIFITGCAFITGIIVTGLYPAFVSVRQSPKNIFGMFKTGNSGHWLSHYLTTFQFTVALVLLIWMSTIFHQIHYVLNKYLGLDKDNVLVVDLPINQKANFASSLKYFTEEISRNPHVQTYSVSQSIPCDGDHEYVAAVKSSADPGLTLASNGGCDEKFIPFYKLQLLAGRNFSPGDSLNKYSIMLSKAGAKRLGFERPRDAVGQNIYIMGTNKVTVIGIIDDYKLQPFLTQGVDLSYQGNPGLILTYGGYQNKLRKVAIKIDPAYLDQTISHIETIFTTAFTDDLFHWYFLDQLIDSRYAGYRTSLKQITFYAIVATFIACLGLLGMITNKAVQKTREIGIRRVLGAGHLEITAVLLLTTIKQIFIATIISIPIAWLLTKSYLDNFSERVRQEWWYYALPIFALIIILMGTIIFRLAKILRVKAVESLKYE